MAFSDKSCFLNTPAGQLAKVIVRNSVTEIVAAWSSDSVDPNRAIDSVLQCFVHPALLDHSNKLHQEMMSVVRDWIEGLPSDKKSRILDGLTREGVRQGRHHDDQVRQASHAHGPKAALQEVITAGEHALGYQEAPSKIRSGDLPQSDNARGTQSFEYGSSAYTQRDSGSHEYKKSQYSSEDYRGRGREGSCG